MNWEKMRKMLNRVLTVFAAVMMAVWVWKFFGPGSLTTRRNGMAALGRSGMDFSTLFWISIAVVCCGYLLWRFMGWLFYRKYFHQDPPDDGK
ncbi:MAG: hypothetical protein RRY12_10090 [Cloacibacillus sp.]